MIDEENILINNNKNKIKLGIPYKIIVKYVEHYKFQLEVGTLENLK